MHKTLTLSHPMVCEHHIPCPPMAHVKGDKCVKGIKGEKHVNNITGDKCINTADM